MMSDHDIEEIVMTKKTIAEEILEAVEKKSGYSEVAESIRASVEEDEAPARVSEEPPREISIEEGAGVDPATGVGYIIKKFSEVFGFDCSKHSDIPDHAVKIWDDGFPGVPEVADWYIPDKKVLGEISMAYHAGLIANLVGPTGAGKNQDLEYFCSVMKIPYTRIEMNEEVAMDKVFGKTDITDGDTVFSPGLFPRSMKLPGIVVVDEFSRGPAYAMMMFQRPFDRREFVAYESKAEDILLKPHPDWQIFLTDNTLGNGDDMDLYVASNVQDSALINRVEMVIHKDYMGRPDERKIISKLSPEMGTEQVAGLAKFSYLMHQGFKKRQIRSAFSPRNLKSVCTLYNRGMSLQAAVFYNFISRCSESEQSDVKESWRAVFGGDV